MQPGNDNGKGKDKGQTKLVAQEDNDKGKNKGSAVLPNVHAAVSDSACQGEEAAHDTQPDDMQPDDTLCDDEQWSVGDIFQGFEFEVPIPPEGLEWVPTPPQGCYRLVKAGDGQPDELL